MYGSKSGGVLLTSTRILRWKIAMKQGNMNIQGIFSEFLHGFYRTSVFGWFFKLSWFFFSGWGRNYRWFGGIEIKISRECNVREALKTILYQYSNSLSWAQNHYYLKAQTCIDNSRCDVLIIHSVCYFCAFFKLHFM